MANTRREPVSYQPFRAQPTLADGLIEVNREGGDTLRRVSAAFFRIADQAGQYADQQTDYAYGQASRLSAHRGRPNATVSGGDSLAAGGVDDGDYRTQAAELLRQEEGFRDTPYWDKTALRTGYGSDTVTLADGTFKRVTAGMKITRGDAERDLTRRIGLTENTIAGQLGQDAWARLPGRTRAALISVGYNYGSLPGSVVSAVRDGTDVQGAVAALSANKERRQREAALIGSGQDFPIITQHQDGRVSTPDLKGVQPAVLDRFRQFQATYGAAVPIVSGYRDPARNRAAGGALHSEHMNGDALDLDVTGKSEAERIRLIRAASAAGFTGIGVYGNSIHIDTGARRAWGPTHHADSIPAWAAGAVNDHLNGTSQSPGPATADPAVTLTGGTWRPMEGNTIAARAWNREGEKVYLQELDAEMRSTTGQLFDRYRNDPAGLERAYGDLKGELAKDHVFPEILPDFEIGFDQLAQHYLDQARENQTADLKAKNEADVYQRTGEIKTDLARQLAGLDPSKPGAADALHKGLAALDSNYDTAADMGTMTQLAAAKAKAADRRDVATQFYERQADALDADQVAALHQRMQADFAAGRLDGIDADGWQSLDAKLTTLENTKRTAANAAVAKLTKAGDALADRAAAGYALDPTAVNQFNLTAGAAGAQGAEIVEATNAKIAAASAVRDLPLGDAQSYVDTLRNRLGNNPTDAQVATLKYAEDQLDKKAKAIKADPLGEAARAGIVQLAPIDTTTPESLDASMQARQDQAKVAAAHYGVPVQLFRPEEEKALKSDMQSLDPARFTGAMKQLDYLMAGNGIAEVESAFGSEAANAVQDWDVRLRYDTPDQIAAWLKDRADPKWQERVKPLVAKGESEARKVSFEDIVKQLDTNNFLRTDAPIDADTKRLMMNDFVTLSGERYATTQDAGQAQKQAIERMGRIWGVTGVYGTLRGRLMAFPPDRYYPDVGGSRDWLAAEMADVAKAHGVDLANLTLVADGKTKKAADQHEQPGYLMSVVNPETGLDELVTDEKGRPLRHFFDPAAAQAKALAKAREERRTQNDPWIVINRNTSIGPFYPPWQPPSEQDLQMRQKRIDEITTQQDDAYEQRKRQHQLIRRLNSNWEKQ